MRETVFHKIAVYFRQYNKRQGIIGVAIEWVLALAALLFFGIKVHILLGVLMFLLVKAGAYVLKVIIYKPEEYNEEGNRVRSTADIYGNAHLMDDDEKKEAMNSGNYETLLENYLGADVRDPRKLYSLKRSSAQNGNMIFFGAPGSGKSAGLVIPTIMQTIRRGESLVVTDPKGELYRKTSLMARKHGYTVKVINFNTKTMLHSDSVNYMSGVKDDLRAIDFAQTICDNTNSGLTEDFFDKSEKNLLQALILYVINDETRKSKTLTDVYKMLVEKSAMDLADEFEQLTWDSPAKGPASNFATSGDRVMGDTKGGLGVRLGTLNNPILQRISSIDDIDFTLPGREKCIYYVVTNDHSSTLKFYQSLFFTILFAELADYADYETGNAGKLPVKVTFLLDEFPSLGKMPNIQSAMATYRGRGMDFILIVQNFGQLQMTYPNNEWESIVDCCTTRVCLRTNSLATAQYFKDLCGIETIVTRTKRFEKSEMDLAEVTMHYTASDAPNKRDTLNADQVLRLKDDEQLVIISGHNPVILKKPYYFLHPMCKEMIETNIMYHVPKWIKQILVGGDELEMARFGIKKDEWIAIASHDDELLAKIELCTKNDFKHAWTREKQAAMDKKYYGTRQEMDEEDEEEARRAEEIIRILEEKEKKEQQKQKKERAK